MTEHTQDRFGGRVIVVVGASADGIGGATALRLAREAAAVVIGDINPDSAAEVAAAVEATGSRGLAVQTDITDESSLRELIGRAEREFGRVDGLVNVVGGGGGRADSDAVDIDLAVFDRVIATDLRGFLLSCRQAIPALLRSGGGSIVNITSIRALAGTPRMVSYSCAKAGIIALTRHIATRWGAENIRCNAIAPGLIVTGQMRRLMATGAAPFSRSDLHGDIILPREGEPDDVAGVAAMLLSPTDGKYITGQVLTVDGGELAHYRRK